MEDYMKKYESFDKIIVYDFQLGYGGIGDNIKFFIFILEMCIKNNKRLYYKINNIEIEKYIKLKYYMMYIDEDMIGKLDCVEVVIPLMFYSSIHYNFTIDVNKVFYFTDEVKINSKLLFPKDIDDYISIHLRLGDKHLETEKKYIQCPEDKRDFSEEKINNFIEENYNKNIFFLL